MLTDEKIEDILMTFEVMNPKDPWWNELAKALIEEAQPSIEQAARAEALEDAAELCKENAEKWYKSNMEKQHFIGAAIGADKCRDAIRDLINKEQAQ